MRGLPLPRLEPLSARLVTGITLLIVIPLAAGLYWLSWYQYRHTVQVRSTAADLETRMLEAALREQMLGQMLRRDSEATAALLRAVASQPEVRRAMIVDHTGVVRLSSRDQDLGTRLSPDSPTCAVCHAARPSDRPRSVLFQESGVDVLRTVLPIENRAECYGCHSPSRQVNGILVLDVSLATAQAQHQATVRRIGAATVVLVGLMLGGVGWLLRRLVFARLARLGRTARAIAAGAFSARAEVGGRDVIDGLARDFNAMADSTVSLIAELRAREREGAGILDSLDDGLIVLDRTLGVVAVNRSVAQGLSLSRDAVAGRPCREVICSALPCGGDGRGCPTLVCLASGKSQRAVYEDECPGNGDRRVKEVQVSPIFAEDGSVWRVVEVWRDITERVREEERLAEIEHLTSLGVLASGLSHQLNTPLATALTCAEAIVDRLEDRGPDGDGVAPGMLEAVRESARAIQAAVLRCRAATSQFVGFARRIPLTTEPVDLVQAVQAVLALAWPTARERGVELRFVEPGGRVPFVRANTEAVQHVVLNVLVNAIESFSRPGGEVAARVLVGDDVRLQIRDTGSGMPPEVQRHLFQPFRTSKPGGTGLGLFLSRTLMRRLDGDVRLVESAVGRGSCVEIVFPRA